MEERVQLLNKIDELYPQIRDGEGGLRKFYNWYFSGGVIDSERISTGGMYNVRTALLNGKLNRNTITNAKKLIKAYESYLRDLQHQNIGFQGTESKNEAPNFQNCSWFFYYYRYTSSAGGHCTLGRAVLSVKENGIDACLQTVDKNQETEYIGKLNNVWLKRFATFEFTGKTYDKRLYLQVFLGAEPKQIAIGLYLTPDFNGLASGTFVLQLIIKHNQFVNLNPKAEIPKYLTHEEVIPLNLSYILHGEKFNDIPIEIRRFLSFKYNNLLKIPREVYTVDGLGEKISEYRPARAALFLSEEKPVAFISFTNELSSQKEHNEISYLKEQLNQSYSDLIIEYPNMDSNTEIGLLSNFEKIKKTTYFIFISSVNKKSSPSMIELSWGLAFSKAIILCYKKGEVPHVLTSLTDESRIAHINLLEYDDLTSDILKICNFIKSKINHYRYKNPGLDL